jgi:cell division protein FtsI (penicillin-binding protein 3)
MKVRQKNWIRIRTYVVAVFFVLGLGVMVARAYQLQVLDRDRLEAIAQADYQDRITVPPKRGDIYDREGHELALSVEVGSVYAHPKQIKNKAAMARRLSKVIGENRREILSSLRGDHAFVWIKRQVPPPVMEKVKALEMDGVGVLQESRRYYPGCEIASHLLGFVGADSQGLEGLEKKYDALLKGPALQFLQLRDALGRTFTIRGDESADGGTHDLILTIDKDIQYKAQQALEAAVLKTNAKSGQCVVVDVATGEILAMAVVPKFNPNIFSRYRPEQWRNRVITDSFEPGSTMKAFLLAAALEEHAVTPLTKINCEEGSFEFADNRIHDTHPHGILTVQDIIKYSSNIGAAKIGEKLGYQKYVQYLNRFGFGSRTGVDLLGEQTGFVRSEKNAKKIEQITSYFGQGLTVTTLQLAMAMGAIANGGRLMRPFVVSRVVDHSGKIVQRKGPKVVRQVISEETSREVTRVLEGVVGEKGTGSEAAIKGFKVAGKTGTAQKVNPKTGKYFKHKYEAIFAGFVPADQPRLAIVAMVDEPEGIPYGGLVAGPVFRNVGLWSLNYLRVTPQTKWALVRQRSGEEKISDGEAGSTIPDSRIHVRMPMVVSDGRLPDFSGQTMREVLRNSRSLGLEVQLKGSGLVCEQYPRPGVLLKKVSVLKVQFRPPA